MYIGNRRQSRNYYVLLRHEFLHLKVDKKLKGQKNCYEGRRRFSEGKVEIITSRFGS